MTQGIDLIAELMKISGATAAAVVDLRTGFGIGRGGTIYGEEPGVYPRKSICVDAEKLALLFRHLDGEDDFVRIQLGDAYLSAIAYERALVVVARSVFDGFLPRHEIADLLLLVDPDEWIKAAQRETFEEIEDMANEKVPILGTFLRGGFEALLRAATDWRSKPKGDH